MMPSVHEVQLSNGFRALLVERHNLPVVASMVWYQVGSRDERSGETGLSHFLEHMMFKGTDDYGKGQIDLLTSKMGGSNNAFTDNDVTAYYFSLASDRWETALEIEASRMRNCLLDEAEFEAEKSVVLEELAMGEDDPWRTLFQEAEKLVYQVHPYHHPVIGWKEDLERLDAGAMRRYYERHYGPNRAFLVAVGDLDQNRTETRIRELFEGLPRWATPREQALAEPPQRGERRAVVRFPSNLSRLCMAVRTCRVGEPDDPALDVLNVLLAGGKTSRLYRRLVLDEEVATSVSVHNETRQDPGVLWVAVEMKEGEEPERAEAMVREEIAALAARGPTRAELERARVQLHSGFLFEEETVLDLAMKIGRYEAMTKEGYRLLDRVLPMIDAVGADEVTAVCGRYFGPDAWNVVSLVPAATAAAMGAAASNGAVRRRAAAKRPARGAVDSGRRRKARSTARVTKTLGGKRAKATGKAGAPPVRKNRDGDRKPSAKKPAAGKRAGQNGKPGSKARSGGKRRGAAGRERRR